MRNLLARVCRWALAALCEQRTAFVVLGLGFLVWKRGQRWVGDLTSHGSAKLGDMAMLMQNDMAGDGDGDSLIFGRAGLAMSPNRVQGLLALIDPRVGDDTACRIFISAFYHQRLTSERLIRLRECVHLSTFAPSGQGKSVCVLYPNLLSYSRPCVVFDPAGELFTMTAEHRRRVFNHRIIRIDPYGVCGPGADRYNPLASMKADAPDLIEQCWDLANQLVVRAGTEPDPHWNEKAESVIGSLLFFIAKCEHDPRDRQLITLREMLSSPELFQDAIKLMRRHVGNHLLQRRSSQMKFLQDRELDSVMSTVQRHVEFMDSSLVEACLKDSTFDPVTLRQAALRGQRFTLYLILPQDKLNVMAGLTRLFIGSLLRNFTREATDESLPILFLIDEAASLGRIKTLEAAVTTVRKKGIRLWFFWQSLDQLKECFGERANVILGNMRTTQWFGLNDYDSAEALSKRIGDETRQLESRTVGGSTSRPTGSAGRESPGGSVGTSDSINSNLIARRLFKPEEILTFPDGTGILLHRNLRAILIQLVYHYRDKEFLGGGTGKQPGLNLVAVVMVAVTLGLGVLAASLTAILPDMGMPGVESLTRAVAPVWQAVAGEPSAAPAKPAAEKPIDPLYNIRLPRPGSE